MFHYISSYVTYVVHVISTHRYDKGEDNHAAEHHPQSEGLGDAHVLGEEGGQPAVAQIERGTNPYKLQQVAGLTV